MAGVVASREVVDFGGIFWETQSALGRDLC
jgi:hypothetical protein